MLKNKIINIGIVEDVAIALEEINKEVVFVGGAVVSLYATDVNADEVRPTKDIDISVQVSSYKEMDSLREKLSAKKIYPASDATNTYRYNLKILLLILSQRAIQALAPQIVGLVKGLTKVLITH